jgi:hypothetical protein
MTEDVESHRMQILSLRYGMTKNCTRMGVLLQQSFSTI